MLTDIVVPIYNQLEYTRLFYDSLSKEDNWNLIIIDNGSKEEIRDYINNLEGNVKIIRNDENLGYVKAVNQGLSICSSDSILLANNDIIFTKGLLKRLQDGLEKYDLLGPVSNNIKESDNPLLIKYAKESLIELNDFSSELEEKNRGIFIDVEYLFGHCLMMKKEVFDNVGYLDERFGIGNSDDIDYCRRATQEGFQIGLRKDSFVYHFCHATFNHLNIDIDKLIKKNKEILDKKWE